jgi:hypothetical protein
MGLEDLTDFGGIVSLQCKAQVLLEHSPHQCSMKTTSKEEEWVPLRKEEGRKWENTFFKI